MIYNFIRLVRFIGAETVHLPSCRAVTQGVALYYLQLQNLQYLQFCVVALTVY
jgi:hypothetical protein